MSSTSEFVAICNYGIHIILLYFWVIPSVSTGIHDKCTAYWKCNQYLKETYFGYTVDMADGQWRELRSSMWLLWLAMISVSCAHFLFRIMTISTKLSGGKVHSNSGKHHRHYKSITSSTSSNSSPRRSSRLSVSSSKDSNGSSDIDDGIDATPSSSIQPPATPASAMIEYKSPASDYVRVPPSSYFRLIVGLGFVILLHGNHAIVVLLISYIGYIIAKGTTPDPKCLQSTYEHSVKAWLYALFILLLKESYRLTKYPAFRFLIPAFDKRNGGMYGWQLPANFLVLRIVSFSFDHHWAIIHFNNMKYREESMDVTRKEQQQQQQQSDTQKNGSMRRRGKSNGSLDSTIDSSTTSESTSSQHKSKRSNHSNGSRSSNDSKKNHHQQQQHTLSSSSSTASASKHTANDACFHRWPEEYNFINYISYILYPPLYMAGPIMSFNDFVENTNRPQRAENPFIYGIRWLLCMGLMEFMTNKYPFFAIVSSGLLPYLTVSELSVFTYVILKMMWLKFTLVWRFFRLWAMADGTLAPENMQRCMSNNYSLEKFWRGWHSSFNKWIIRYMYKPMGGRSNRVWSVWPIFLFVAIWHDIELKLLMWGLLNASFYVLELIGGVIASTETMKSLHAVLFQMICMLAAATYIIILICVNMLGYAVGIEGVASIVDKASTWDGVKVLFVSYYFLSQGISFMKYLKLKGLTAND